MGDKTNVNTFEDSPYSDVESNCSKESTEVLISRQGVEDEANDEVVIVAEEKDEDNNSCHPCITESLVNR
jgi:hypothetical protein